MHIEDNSVGFWDGSQGVCMLEFDNEKDALRWYNSCPDFKQHDYLHGIDVCILHRRKQIRMYLQRSLVSIIYMYLYTLQLAYIQVTVHTLREESSQTNVILQYKLLASSFSAVCYVIQQS